MGCFRKEGLLFHETHEVVSMIIAAEDEDDVGAESSEPGAGIPQAKQHPKLEGGRGLSSQESLFGASQKVVPHTLALP